MKFLISTQELNYLITKALNVVSAKTAIPILSNFLIEAKGNELKITATDLTVGICCRTEAKILEEGATTLPAKRFAQLIRELTAINVEVSTNANDVTEIHANSSRFRLNGMSYKEFPALPDISNAVHFTIKQADLKDMLFRTSFAVSRDDNRYALTGVSLKIAGGSAIFAGTDGKRLARAHTPLDFDPTYNGSFVLPLKAVEEVVKNLSDDGNAILYLMQDKIAVQTGHFTVISKLLNGEYPDINRVIPNQLDSVVTLHREELTTLLRQISLFTGDTNQSVRFSFTSGELKLTANAMEIGEGIVSMPVNYQGERLDIAFNPLYFLDILRHSKGETVTIGLTDPFNPGVLTDQEVPPTISHNPSPLFVLMPMRITEE